jgi:hypothetical protein
MVENLLKPSGTSKLLEANVVFLGDVSLLHLNPEVAEASARQI